jgi:hypothetical protein
VHELEKISENFIVQARSRYQIENFVIGQHDTEEMQYRQIIIEAQDLIHKIKKAEVQIEKMNIEIQALSKGDRLKQLDAADKALDKRYLEITLAGSYRELAVLQDLFNAFPKYSADEIERNQKDYWEKRLTRQAHIEALSAQQGVSSGNLTSMLQANLLRNEVEA